MKFGCHTGNTHKLFVNTSASWDFLCKVFELYSMSYLRSYTLVHITVQEAINFQMIE
jgi:hypothetical protein